MNASALHGVDGKEPYPARTTSTMASCLQTYYRYPRLFGD